MKVFRYIRRRYTKPSFSTTLDALRICHWEFWLWKDETELIYDFFSQAVPFRERTWSLKIIRADVFFKYYSFQKVRLLGLKALAYVDVNALVISDQRRFVES